MFRSAFIFLISYCLLLGIVGVGQVSAGFMSFFSELPAPAFETPPDGSRFTVGDLPPYISWSEVVSADRYEIRFSVAADMATAFSLFTVENHLDLADMIPQNDWDPISVQLFCQVRALNHEVPVTAWSNILEFAKSRDSSPIVKSPVDDARFTTGEALPIFEWSETDYAQSYIIEFASDPDFMFSYGQYELSETRINCNDMGDRTIWDALIGTYFWRVCSLDANGVPSPESEASSFSKTIGAPPDPSSPEDDYHFSPTEQPPVFQWDPLPHEPTEYHIQFAYDLAPFPDGGGYIEVTGPSFTFESIGITNDLWYQFYGKLRWRVSGVDRYGNHGGFSQSFSFTKVSAVNYMAFGDSVTGGYGASDWGNGYAGYPPRLRAMLRQRYSDKINVFCQESRSWFPGAHGYTGSDKIVRALEYFGPRYSLVMLGIVDIVDDGAPGCDDYDCHTIEHLTIIIDAITEHQSIPYLATLPPVNPDSSLGYLQDSVDELNDEIRNLAFEKSVAIAALDEAFFSAPLPLEDYYTSDPDSGDPDFGHFNDLGYQLIAETWNGIL